MRAWLLDKLGGGISSLRIGDVHDPAPRADHVIVDIHRAGLNPADRYLSEGMYPAKPNFPHILGRDGLGIVAATGKKVIVFTGEAGINTPGTFAEKLATPSDTLVEVPHGWTDEQAAGAPLVYITAYQALTQFGPLDPSVVLITGASGGVGVASVQLAKALGHTVVALSRDADKSRKLREIGADFTFDPNDAAWKKSLKEQLGKRRVDLAIDNIGGTLFNDLLDTLGNHGKVSCVGRLAGPVPEFNTASLFFRRIRIGGVAVHAFTNSEARNAWIKVLKLMSRTNARPLVDSVFDFDKLPDAFERLAKGPMGKVLLKIR